MLFIIFFDSNGSHLFPIAPKCATHLHLGHLLDQRQGIGPQLALGADLGPMVGPWCLGSWWPVTSRTVGFMAIMNIQ